VVASAGGISTNPGPANGEKLEIIWKFLNGLQNGKLIELKFE
jgi:hypothetical protein